MPSTITATAVQLARADAIGKVLLRRGWLRRAEQPSKHPGAHASTAWQPRPAADIQLLILTFGGRRGQMAEILAGPAPNLRPDAGGHLRSGRRPSWRFTAYDAPAQALVAAALTAVDDPSHAPDLESAGWRVERPRYCNIRSPRITTFTRADRAVTARFHNPTYSPPCERCTHFGDLGDAGGWTITGPGFAVDATAHTPEHVITAFARALPGSASALAPEQVVHP